MSEADAKKLDEVAAALVAAYQRAGVFAAVTRTFEVDDIRSIHPAIGAEHVAEFFHKVADKVFDGPCTITYPRGKHG